MPDRIIHERACHSPTLNLLSDGAERMFWRLTTKADDQGRFDGDPCSLLAACFPLRVGRIKPDRAAAWRDELAAASLIDVYQVGEHVYGQFRTWGIWQRRRESRPKRPGPDDPMVLRQVAAGCGGLRLARAPVESRESLTTESRESGGGTDEIAAADRGGSLPPTVFHIPDSVTRALSRAPRLGSIGRNGSHQGNEKCHLCEDPEWWQAQIRAFPTLDLAVCILKAEAWLVTNPKKAARKKDARQFLHNWFKGDD